MDAENFAPVYEAIRADFGFDRAADEAARDRLVALDPKGSLMAFERALGDRNVAIAAPGPTLEDDLGVVHEADAVLAVSTAASTLRDADIAIDAYVTDLDADPELAPSVTEADVPTAVHAHGDNAATVAAVVPECDREHVLGTTQVEPREPVVNVGGFTDGDRAAFLADHVGAASLAFPGWDLEPPTGSVSPTKRRKLEWAARLLVWLEERRGERFAELDGIREGVDLSALPIEDA
jgi:uncharacterized Rossmann fold enzyme